MSHRKHLNLLVVVLLTLPSVELIASPKGATLSMNMLALRQKAFKLCQAPYKKLTVEPVPEIDPPPEGIGIDGLGLTYQEESMVQTKTSLSKDNFYLKARPRLAGNNWPMDVFIDYQNSGRYTQLTWEDAEPDFSVESPQFDSKGNPRPPLKITPTVDPQKLPKAAKVLTELTVGHLDKNGGWPGFFVIRSNGYIRFAGLGEGQRMGSSMRLGAHRIWRIGEKTKDQSYYPQAEDPALFTTEDFPRIRELYANIINKDTAELLILIEGELFCSALKVNIHPGENTNLVVDGHWYFRNDYDFRKDPNTALIAYSSMMYQNEFHTPEDSTDEAHDSDTLRVQFSDGSTAAYPVLAPPNQSEELYVNDISALRGKNVMSWALANEDRDPNHYMHFDRYIDEMIKDPATGEVTKLIKNGYYPRVSYRVDILNTSVDVGLRLYAHSPQFEWADNVVGASTIRQNIPKSKSVKDSVHFKYQTTSYFPREKPQ